MAIDRNTVGGFAQRVRKNLAFMIVAHESGEDVHIVTELTNALLGLIVFPYEHLRKAGVIDLRKHQFNDMTVDGWPIWTFNIGCSTNLDNHIWHLRNALSHQRVRFSSDARLLEEVEITFSDRPPAAATDNWSATINAAALLAFVLRFSEIIDPHN